MTNQILRNNKILRGEDDEPETYHSRQQDTLEEASGRFAGQIKSRIITGGRSHPMLPKSYSWQDHPEKSDPYTDKVDVTTSMTFDQDLTTLSGNPPQGPSLPSAPATHDGEALTPAAAPSSLSKPRRF